MSKGKTLEAVPAPPLALSEISPRDAEELCRDWMKHLGAPDAEVTQFVGDGGIDIESSKYIAQVKNYSGSVGAPELYQFIGVASVDGRRPLYFTSGTYTRQAIAAASRAGLPLFKYSAAAGTIGAENKWASEIISDGLSTSAFPG